MDPTLELRLAANEAAERADRRAQQVVATLHMLMIAGCALLAVFDVWLLVRQ